MHIAHYKSKISFLVRRNCIYSAIHLWNCIDSAMAPGRASTESNNPTATSENRPTKTQIATSITAIFKKDEKWMARTVTEKRFFKPSDKFPLQVVDDAMQQSVANTWKYNPTVVEIMKALDSVDVDVLLFKLGGEDKKLRTLETFRPDAIILSKAWAKRGRNAKIKSKRGMSKDNIEETQEPVAHADRRGPGE